MFKQELFDSSPKVKKKRLNPLPENPEEPSEKRAVGLGRFPSWLHRKMPKGKNLKKTSAILEGNRLHTVCEEAKCPNLLECWTKKTATFLLMGKECTRSCGFCDIDFNTKPMSLDPKEIDRVADSVKQLGLTHVVMTMVARDDLPDGGAQHLADVINEVRRQNSKTTIEVLTSDFEGNKEAYDTVLKASPEIFNYNIETVRELSPRIRHKATYDRTLELIRYVKNQSRERGMHVKSGIMVGLGETTQQVEQTIQDLKDAGCDIITIGQYLQANRHKFRVKAFITPEQFKEYENFGYSIGVTHMYCGPFVRSSYNAHMVKKLTDQSA
jgi:lipoyl synthase